jgi:hypothetical protein
MLAFLCFGIALEPFTALSSPNPFHRTGNRHGFIMLAVGLFVSFFLAKLRFRFSWHLVCSLLIGVTFAINTGVSQGIPVFILLVIVYAVLFVAVGSYSNRIEDVKARIKNSQNPY